jgi:hypothetical protein
MGYNRLKMCKCEDVKMGKWEIGKSEDGLNAKTGEWKTLFEKFDR